MNPFELPENLEPQSEVIAPIAGERMPKRKSKREEAKTGRYRASNVEMFSREITVNENDDLKIYSRDADNLYPLRMEKAINNSPTGRRCANLMSKYIQGKRNADNYDVGDGYKINDILREASLDLAYQGGVFFKVKYKVDTTVIADKIKFKPTLSTLDYILMAVSKEDDENNQGRFYVLKTDSNGEVLANAEDVTEWYYPFSNNSDVILFQMYNDCRMRGITAPTMEELVRNYRGQVNYLNTTPKFKYALGLADSVYNDLDTEARIGNYNNIQTRKGFLGKTVIKMYDNGDDDNEDFVTEVKDYLGADNSGNVLVVEVPANSDAKLNEAFIVDQLKPQFDDKMFETTVKNLKTNILGAFNNIPEPLIFSASGALFGTNPETYQQMKTFYWEQCEDLREQLTEELLRMGFKVEIQPII